ncbi:MAG: polyprenyl synthetase family protein, partial [Leptospirales bacterium]|nr:polyprenyl synthetase family protein [Leptospirales bacterium]
REILKDFSGEMVPEIDAFINEFFDKKISIADLGFIKEILRFIKEYCLRDGKRIRPLLLLNSYIGYKSGIKKRDEIIKLGAVIEMMHSLLLIQDDIIDRSEMRRGAKALHIQLGERYSPFTNNRLIGQDIASVTADILFSLSIEIISESKIRYYIKDRFLKIFSKTYEKTAWGQILDSLNTMPKNIDPQSDMPLHVSIMKTAYYTMVYPLTMGYILSGGNNKNEIANIESFAIPLGIAFQARDDLLGIFGIEKDTGKPNDSDILEGKITLPVHNTMRKLSGPEREKFIKLFLKIEKSKKDVDLIRKSIRSCGALDETIKFHRKLIDDSYNLLDNLAMKRYNKDVMRGIIESVEDINIGDVPKV